MVCAEDTEKSTVCVENTEKPGAYTLTDAQDVTI